MKLSAQFWKLDSTLPEGLFEENYVLRKKISWKYFLYFNQIFIFFCRICSACLSKLRPCFQMNVLRKIFFVRTNSFSRGIFRNQVENCRTLHWIFNRKLKVPFNCLEELFRETFVLAKNINRSKICPRSRGEFLFGGLGKNRAIGRKGSARLPKQDYTLPKCFIEKHFVFWIDKCLETFLQTFGCFFSDSCNKQQKIVKLFFYLSRAIPPCEIYFPEKKQFGNFSQFRARLF